MFTIHFYEFLLNNSIISRTFKNLFYNELRFPLTSFSVSFVWVLFGEIHSILVTYFHFLILYVIFHYFQRISNVHSLYCLSNKCILHSVHSGKTCEQTTHYYKYRFDAKHTENNIRIWINSLYLDICGGLRAGLWYLSKRVRSPVAVLHSLSN